MARLTITQAVEKLAERSLSVTDAEGRPLAMTPLAAKGTRLRATADRLRIGAAGQLVARVHGDDLRPWIVTFEIEALEYHTADLARVTLRGRGIKLDEQQRRSERTALGGHARLVAINCQDVVDGDVVDGSIVDVSDNGIAIRTQRRLRAGDRLRFTGRFFATVIEAEVRVARVADVAGQVQAGCTFVAIDPAERRKLRAVTSVRPSGEAATFTVLHELAAARLERERANTGWRRFLRRSA